jgi:hypothetical protein
MPPQCGRAPRAAPARQRPTENPDLRAGLGGATGLSSPFPTTGATREARTCRAGLLRLVDAGRGPRRRTSGRPALDHHHVEPGLDVASGLSLAATPAARLRAVRPARKRGSHRPTSPAFRPLRHRLGRFGPYLPATVLCCPNASDGSAYRSPGSERPRGPRSLPEPRRRRPERRRSPPPMGAGKPSPAPD